MSDEDDILAIVAALEFLAAGDTQPPQAISTWKRLGESSGSYSYCHGEGAPIGAPLEPWSRPARSWKNS